MKAIDGLTRKDNHPFLIPSFKETERKLLSVFMAVLEIVPEFRGEVLRQCNYGSGKTCNYRSFMEPKYSSPSLPNLRPDGLIVCTRGKNSWSAFIEAKADKKIRVEQIQEYADMARQLEIDAVISISNEYAISPTELPYHLAGNKRRKRDIYHLSWPEIRTAIGLFIGSANNCNEAEIAILRHALNFFLSDGSGVSTYDSMPQNWKKFVESAGTELGFSSLTSGVMEIVRGWQQERRDLCAKLNGETGGGVELRHLSGARTTRQDQLAYDKKLLANQYQLKASYYFKQSKCQLEVTSDLRACGHTFVMQISFPVGKKAKATIVWLKKQLEVVKDRQHKIVVKWPGFRSDNTFDLDHLLNFPETIYEGQKEAPRSIKIITSHRDVRRFKSPKRFIEDLEQNTLKLVQELTACGFLFD